jgi:PPOX class probable F420-dependent enzyme
MLKIIPAEFQDLLGDDVRAFVYLATLMKDGSPQVTPIWFNADDTHILINSAKGRVKDKNMRARPQVALLIQDPIHHLRYIQVRGRVVEITEEGGYEHINHLSHKYDQKDFPKRPGQVRVIYKILPEHVSVNNS